MSTTMPMPGVTRHPNGGWRVRISPFPAVAGFRTVDEANEYAVELRKLKRQGILVAPSRLAAQKFKTLRDYAEHHLERLADIGGRNGNAYSAEGIAKARGDARPWLGEPIPARKRKGVVLEAPAAVDATNRLAFADTPVRALRLPSIEQYLQRRAKTTRRAAVGEQQSLQAILRLALRHGEPVDPALLALDPIRRTRTKRTGPSLVELRYLADHAQESQRRILLLGGTLGGRIMELLRSEDGWYDLDERTVTIPSWAAKERREKILDLLPEEVALIREQRLVRSAQTRTGPGGTPWTFPRVEGGEWKHHSGFWNRVVVPCRQKAARAWREEHGLAVDAATPFEWVVIDAHGKQVIDVDGLPKVGGFAPHDLRRSASTLLIELKVPHELVAARLGHKDAGHLIATTYAETRRERLRAELDAIAADGGIDGRLAKLAGVGG